MEIRKHHIDDRTGTIVTIDEPGDLDTMHTFIHEQQRKAILDLQRNELFVLVVFEKIPKKKSEACLEQTDWYPIEHRLDMHTASDWHVHNGVIIHCPHQEEVVIPTGISTDRFVREGRKSTGIEPLNNTLPSRERQLILNDAITKFTPDVIQPSGYSLIIPAGEMHVKLAAPEDHNGTGGTIHRKAW